MSYGRQVPKSRRFRVSAWKAALTALLASPLLTAGVVAVLHLLYVDSPHPLVRLVVVSGDSMQPTFSPGDQLLFGRRQWHDGSVVLADIPDEGLVVKRIVNTWQGWAVITGDNSRVTATYRIPVDSIAATLVLRTGLRLPSPPSGPPTTSSAQIN